jgi:hypothetical protein
VLKEFEVNQRVRIRVEGGGTNRRVPEYARGMKGTIVRSHGIVPGYAHDHTDDWGPLYSVLLDRSANDSDAVKILLDIHGSWLLSEAEAEEEEEGA